MSDKVKTITVLGSTGSVGRQVLAAVDRHPDRFKVVGLSAFTNEKLLRMLSNSTFDLHDVSKKPTALFIILPDEVDTYAPIAGLMLQQISATLVQDAYKCGGKLPRRVNFLCDEFCNYYVPGMMRSISAHRSRNIRWYLVCQSQKQLEACYVFIGVFVQACRLYNNHAGWDTGANNQRC